MGAPRLIVSGQSATFDVAVTSPPGRRDVPGLRLRLRNPSGQERVVRDGIKITDGKATTAVILRETGWWEWQWQSDSQVYEHGTVFVRKTGFSS